jgi:hypothetical protein
LRSLLFLLFIFLSIFQAKFDELRKQDKNKKDTSQAAVKVGCQNSLQPMANLPLQKN